jgi:hypothetical protein
MSDEPETGLAKLMRRLGIEVTRRNYLDLAYLGEPPAELGEEEGYLPRQLRTDGRH